MTDPTMNSEDVLKKISRRNMLRDTAITATGVVILPPFLTGCRKELWDMIPGHGHGGVGEVPLTNDQLKNAADNLDRMRDLLHDLYDLAHKYDEVVLTALASTKENPSWTNFIVDILIDIAVAMASAAAIVAEGPLAVPAIACLSAFLHDWGIGKDVPQSLNELNGFFSVYQEGQLRMQIALDEKLGHLTEEGSDENNPYPNLVAAWKDPIEFNGKSWTLADLADSFFPDKTHHADEYYKVFNPMYDHHRKSVWNLAVMKCCSYYENYHRTVVLEWDSANHFSLWAKSWYRDNPGVYIRGYATEVRNNSTLFTFVYWNLGIGGNAFPAAAINELFIDDVPNNIINPNALFNRSYVFQQFSVTKPDWKGWHELASDGSNFAPSDDFVFTGGYFPKLTQ